MTNLAAQLIQEKYPQFDNTKIVDDLYRYTYVSLKNNYCYFGIPKCGSSYLKSVIHELEELPGIKPTFDYLPDVSLDMKIHIREQFYMPSLDKLDPKDFNLITQDRNFSWIVVYRNPYERILSAWADKILSRAPSYIDYINLHFPSTDYVTFNDFVSHLSKLNLETCDCHWRMQNFCGFPNLFPTNKVYTIREIPYLVNLLEQKTGRKSKAKPLNENAIAYKKQMSSWARERIASLYKEEISFFKERLLDCLPPPIGQPLDGLTKQDRAIIDRNLMIKTLFDQNQELRRESQRFI